MRSASDGGIRNGNLQMLHIHLLLAAPLYAGYMAEPGTDQHEDRVAVRETAHHTAAADLPGSLLALMSMNRLEHLRHQIHLGTRWAC